jgi:hypothetical protein
MAASCGAVPFVRGNIGNGEMIWFFLDVGESLRLNILDMEKLVYPDVGVVADLLEILLLFVSGGVFGGLSLDVSEFM